MRYLGIDFGTKKVGIALSDDAGTMGFPRAILVHDAALLDTLVTLVKDEKVGGIVMGESRNYSGEENTVMAKARAFGDALSLKTGIEVVYEPEMLTTQEAKRDFEGEHRGDRGAVDASAAALILTSYLSRRHT
jgi:putative holliday junction resolvase